MSQPEISRRCLQCGASVRHSARFCPQCGADGGEDAAARSNEGGSGVPASTEEVAETFAAWRAATVAGPSGRNPGEGAEAGNAPAQNVSVPPRETLPPPPPRQEAPPTPPATAAEVPPPSVFPTQPPPLAQRRRPSTAAVRDNLRPRAERLREASAGVLEEAAEDTGLRFVLIALFVFVVFAVLLALTFILD